MKAITYGLVGCAVLLSLSAVAVLGAIRVDPSLLHQSRWKQGQAARIARADARDAGRFVLPAESVAPVARKASPSDSVVAVPPLITLDGRIHPRGPSRYGPMEVAQPVVGSPSTTGMTPAQDR